MTLDLRLAPMAAVTNAPFRLVARECGAGPLTSEEIDARALVAGNARTLELTRVLPGERPIAMQLLGADPDVLAEAARPPPGPRGRGGRHPQYTPPLHRGAPGP